MRFASRLSREVVRQMNRALFDVSRDGILRYLDPTIGALHNGQRQIAVRAEPGRVALELWIGGRVAEVFSLVPDAQEACTNAFFAYFSAFENLCRRERLNHMAA